MFDINYLELFKNIPPEIATMLVGMLPISELRGAIPLAINGYHLSVSTAFFWAVLGNIIPPIIFVFFLEGVSNFLSKHFVFWKKFFDWFFERTRRKAQKQIEKYGAWGLFVFVALPLPMTGGWSGAVAAFIFGIKKRVSVPIIILGILAAGIIVSVLTVGVNKIF